MAKYDETKRFNTGRELAIFIRDCIDKQAYEPPPAWEELVAFLGKLLETEENRNKLFKPQLGKLQFAKAVLDILRKRRIETLKKALHEYHPEKYASLLDNGNGQF